MKFQLVLDGDGSRALTVKPENDGEKQLLAGLLGLKGLHDDAEKAVSSAEVRAEFNGQRPPYRKVEALTVVFHA